jgi:hypothetical protein
MTAMVKIDRSPLPKGITINSAKDYRSEPVYSLLYSDFYGKCYICEDTTFTSPEIEHRVSQSNNAESKYDWHNLFLCCSHCNGIKGNKYDNIIDCTVIDPESYLSLAVSNIKDIVIKIKGDIPGLQETAELLDKVYNGIQLPITDSGCTKLRTKVFKEISEFRNLIFRYFREENGNIKRIYKRQISERIRRSSAFAAFKREIVRDQPDLSQIFQQDLA